MTGYLGKTTNRSGDILRTYPRVERENTWGPLNGEVVDFDPAKQTATVRPLYKPIHDGKKVDMPDLLEVPVRFARAGHGAMTWPIQKGEKVKLIPMFRSTEEYHTGGDDEAGNWARSHDLSDMEAHLAGGESLKDPIQNFDDANSHWRFNEPGSYGIRGSKDGKVAIEGNQGNIYKLLADVVELLSNDTLVIKYGSSAGSGHQLEFKEQYAEIAAKLRAMQL
ncbi:hypothetical protein CSC94_12770 [Zhengella mangrovi]|uniref:Phage protein Gp138 N-terminal domain-containing protein n=1 Tax=Zhengella mangrovi TaxID=1982044 RepID=A0A2G1QM03_9HYPH|nr:Gp138 family membrane-puncturing spike protein [Zhengella mangrovi]PHP66556.1 hypothetical protein CSC94_12770 [Zhengella mangrovi]